MKVSALASDLLAGLSLLISYPESDVEETYNQLYNPYETTQKALTASRDTATHFNVSYIGATLK